MSSSPDRAPTPLDGLVVADLTSSVAGQYAGRMLAMYGATVVLVEPPHGTATRRMPPLSPDGESFLHRHLNQGKRSIVVDDERDRGANPDVLADLLRRADVVLRDQGSPVPVDLADTIVECEIGDFPVDGPYAGWRGSEMVHQALGGVMAATGSPDREPIYGVGHRSAYAAGTTAYISVVAALHERRSSGRGQRVRTTVFEAVAAMGQNLVSRYSYNRTQEGRGRYAGFLAILRCADAWVVLFALRNWPSLCRVFGREDLIDDPRFATSGARLANWETVIELLQERAWAMAADDVVDALQAGRVSAEKVNSLADLVGSEHWRARGMLTEVRDPATGRVETALRRLFVIEGVETGVGAPSPALEPAGVAR